MTCVIFSNNFLVLFLYMNLCCAGVSCRKLVHGLQDTPQNPKPFQTTPPPPGSTEVMKSVDVVGDHHHHEVKKIIGSSPPSCEHKCYGCMPCEAIQVPTISGIIIGIEYTNYEPEGWKCKCGPTLYSP